MSWKRKLELQFTENCVLREFSGLKVDNQDVYTLPHESKETALIFQKVLYHAIVPGLQKNRDVTCGARWRGESMVLGERPIQSKVDFRRCNIKEERGGDLGDERTPRSGEPPQKGSSANHVVEQEYCCWQFCHYRNLEENQEYLTCKEPQK
jgi:hypothetical protein